VAVTTTATEHLPLDVASIEHAQDHRDHRDGGVELAGGLVSHAAGWAREENGASAAHDDGEQLAAI
jgi:hypothetical protein